MAGPLGSEWGRCSGLGTGFVLYLGRRELAGGMDYAGVSAAVKRFKRRFARDARSRRLFLRIRRNMVEC
jgi:hypothetical protein